VEGEKHKKWLVPMRSTRTVQAVAVPAAPSFADSAEFRKHLAESYGFRKIGEPLPGNVTLKDILDTLPKRVEFSKNQLH
jgi:omega-6 fatty acid desaturase (delta-12 desaturase)